MKESRIKIQIGQFEREYTVVETTAPKAYDGQGTFELKDSMEVNGTRVIMVNVRNSKWQEGRNLSGLFSYEFLGGVEGWVRENLYEKLTADLEVN